MWIGPLGMINSLPWVREARLSYRDLSWSNLQDSRKGSKTRIWIKEPNEDEGEVRSLWKYSTWLLFLVDQLTLGHQD